MDTIDALELAWHEGAPLVGSLSAADLDQRTPCAEWDVRGILQHQLEETGMFTRVNLGEPAHLKDEAPGAIDWSALRTAWESVGADNVASWRKSGLEGERAYPFGTFRAEFGAVINLGEVLLHSWDLAQATGQEFTPDPAIVSIVYGMYSHMDLTPFRNPYVFGDEVAVAADAPEFDRLLGLLGRHP